MVGAIAPQPNGGQGHLVVDGGLEVPSEVGRLRRVARARLRVQLAQRVSEALESLK